MPQRPVRATIEKRRGESAFQAISTFAIDPAGDAIDRSAVAARRARGYDARRAASLHAKADIAILGDGYRESEYSKFAGDAARAAGYLFSVEPFKARRRDFNVRSVFAPSAESGVTDPYLGLKRNTAFRCAYGSGAAERTLAAEDNRAVREAASAAPYDFLLVLANARRYGGSACFGGPAVVAIDSAAAKYLVIHELAHAMAGLADEYYLPAGDGPVYARQHRAVAAQRDDIAGARQSGATSCPDPPRSRRRGTRRSTTGASRTTCGATTSCGKRAPTKRSSRSSCRTNARGRRRFSPRTEMPRRAGYYEGANGYAKGMFRSGVGLHHVLTAVGLLLRGLHGGARPGDRRRQCG